MTQIEPEKKTVLFFNAITIGWVQIDKMHLSQWFNFIFLTGLLLFTFIYPPFEKPTVSFCLVKNLTNLDCPGCGLGRAFIYASHGDFFQAFTMNPLVFIFYPVAMFVWVRYVGQIFLQKRILFEIHYKYRKILYRIIIIVVLIFYVYRIILTYDQFEFFHGYYMIVGYE